MTNGGKETWRALQSASPELMMGAGAPHRRGERKEKITAGLGGAGEGEEKNYKSERCKEGHGLIVWPRITK